MTAVSWKPAIDCCRHWPTAEIIASWTLIDVNEIKAEDVSPWLLPPLIRPAGTFSSRRARKREVPHLLAHRLKSNAIKPYVSIAGHVWPSPFSGQSIRQTFLTY
jgi:hypothetical protein